MNIKELMVRLDELYTRKNTELRDYIHGASIPIDWAVMTNDYFCEWYENQDDADQTALAYILHTTVDDLLENPPGSDWIKISGKYGKWFMDSYGRNQDDYGRTENSLELEQNDLLPRTTWLVHYTNHPDKIAAQGFTKGVDDMQYLAVTTGMSDKAKSRGGYNFAFLAHGQYGGRNFDGSRDQKYGKHMVFFQSSGVKTFHQGDNEQQIIFWGNDIPKNTIVPVYFEDGKLTIKQWRDDKIVFKTDDYDVLVEWITRNYQQYNGVICNHPVYKKPRGLGIRK